MAALTTIYWLCFGIGMVYVVVAGALGMISGGMEALDHEADFDFDADADADVDFDVDADADMDFDAGGDFDIDTGLEPAAVHDFTHEAPAGGHDGGAAIAHSTGLESMPSYNPFSLLSVMSFMAAFGAGGLLATGGGAGPLPALGIAAVSGLVIAVLFYLIIGRLLMSMQGSSEAHQAEIIGAEAIVVTPVEHDRAGEIAYIQQGTRYTAPARLVTKGRVGRNETVRIRKMEGNIVYVEPRKKLLN